MNVIRWVSLVLFCAVVAAFFQGQWSWELLGAAFVLAGVVVWSCGGFSRDVWFGSSEYDAECARVDAELDAIESRHP